ncbi:MAG: hypothetical protein A2Y63_06650 [Candidatus Riflebacteria bacterium RBG_13_59_9]|nr:MAG: hypothetical protein A2Y63_06650 [Candidatus Riflebacteria bacterium RBG_13_59_9]
MLTALMVKTQARNLGADLVGIASMDRYEGAPKQCDPRYIFPAAKSAIVLGVRIPRGAFRGIEEGTIFSTYPSMGYAAINQVYTPVIMWNLTRYIEDFGWEVVPLHGASEGQAINPVTGNFREGWSRPVRKGNPYPDVFVHYRISAYLAGLGEIGWSKVFLTPEFGPRQRFCVMLTDAELEPDPIYEGKICDRCMLCAKHCIGKAIPTKESVKVTIAGHQLEWGKLSPLACEKGLQGGANKERNPFEHEYPKTYGYGRAIEGAFGCMRACMIHLEERRLLKKQYFNKFRTREPWENIDRTKPYEIDDEIHRYYAQQGKVESYEDYIIYDKTENFGKDSEGPNT